MGSASATFTGTSAGASSYSWTAIDSGWSGTGTSSVFAPTVGTGTGLIICAGVNECGNGPADTLHVSLLPLPVASFSESLHVVGVTRNDTVTYTGAAVPGGTYTWNFGGGTATPGTGAGPQYVAWPTLGHKTVTLTVTDTHGCTSTVFSDTVLVVDTIPFRVVNVYDQSVQVNVTPNPNEGAFDVVFSKAIYGTVWCRFVDMQGREVLTTNQELNGGTSIKVNLGPVAPGIYTATIELNGVLTNIKVNVVK
jgi:hypothetical protein